MNVFFSYFWAIQCPLAYINLSDANPSPFCVSVEGTGWRFVLYADQGLFFLTLYRFAICLHMVIVSRKKFIYLRHHAYIVSDANNGRWPVKTGEKMKIPVIQNQHFWKILANKWKYCILNFHQIWSSIDWSAWSKDIHFHLHLYVIHH